MFDTEAIRLTAWQAASRLSAQGMPASIGKPWRDRVLGEAEGGQRRRARGGAPFTAGSAWTANYPLHRFLPLADFRQIELTPRWG